MSGIPPDDQPVLKALTTALISKELSDTTIDSEPLSAFVNRTFPPQKLPFRSLRKTIETVKLMEYYNGKFPFMPDMSIPGDVGQHKKGVSDFINQIAWTAKSFEKDINCHMLRSWTSQFCTLPLE